MSLLRELEGQTRRTPPGALAARRRLGVVQPGATAATRSTSLPRPIWLYVGRIAVEKSLEDFLSLPLPGTKVVVGDGPSRDGAAAALSPTSCGAGIASATTCRHTSPAPTASCFRRAPRRSATCCSRRWRRACRSRRCPRPARSTSSRKAINGAIDDNLLAACLRARALLAEQGAREHRAPHPARGPRGVPRPPGSGAAADASPDPAAHGVFTGVAAALPPAQRPQHAAG